MRHRAAGEPGRHAAARHHRHLEPWRAQHRGNLRLGLRQHHQQRQRTIGGEAVALSWTQLFIPGEEKVRRQKGLQVRGRPACPPENEHRWQRPWQGLRRVNRAVEASCAPALAALRAYARARWLDCWSYLVLRMRSAALPVPRPVIPPLSPYPAKIGGQIDADLLGGAAKDVCGLVAAGSPAAIASSRAWCSVLCLARRFHAARVVDPGHASRPRTGGEKLRPAAAHTGCRGRGGDGEVKSRRRPPSRPVPPPARCPCARGTRASRQRPRRYDGARRDRRPSPRSSCAARRCSRPIRCPLAAGN